MSYAPCGCGPAGCITDASGNVPAHSCAMCPCWTDPVLAARDLYCPVCTAEMKACPGCSPEIEADEDE